MSADETFDLSVEERAGADREADQLKATIADWCTGD